MKFGISKRKYTDAWSQPARAVWIEIANTGGGGGGGGSQPARAVWIEIWVTPGSVSATASQPARAVWIEIFNSCRRLLNSTVTACEGCVD